MIGFGSTKAGTGGVHGAPLGAKDLSQAKEKFGFNPNEVNQHLFFPFLSFFFLLMI